MKIEIATTQQLEEIIFINKIVDYENSDDFMKENIQASRVLVALKNDRVIGFLLYQDVWGNGTILLTLLKVHSDYYSQGTGTALLQEFEKILASKGITSYMSSVMPNNKKSQKFHEQRGFFHIGDLDMHYGREIFYRKDL